ncbi:MAG: DJ-1/PfpI family protein [Planctomycetes bacterium]|nr:DJ-1/PfpI family protein [Planctomycetota bacterium]
MKTFISLILCGMLVLTLVSPLIAGEKADAKTYATKVEEESEPEAAGKKVLMIVAPKNFADPEFFEPQAVFVESGLEVTVASSKAGTCTGAMGAEAEATLALKDAVVADFDMIVFVGGLGCGVFQTDADALRICKEAVEQEKLLGAICYAPTILAKAGVLKEKQATAVDWKNTHKILEEAGAELVDEAVVQDGMIITANGPKASVDFAQALVKALAKSLAAATDPAAE